MRRKKGGRGATTNYFRSSQGFSPRDPPFASKLNVASSNQLAHVGLVLSCIVASWDGADVVRLVSCMYKNEDQGSRNQLTRIVFTDDVVIDLSLSKGKWQGQDLVIFAMI